METFLRLALNTFVLAGVLGLAVSTLMLIREGESPVRKAVRLIAMLLGFFVFLGARRLGIDVPSLLVAALNNIDPQGVTAVAAAVGGSSGAITTHFILKSLTGENAPERLIHLIILLTSFIVCTLLDVFTLPSQVNDATQTAAFSTNLSFVAAIAFYVIFIADLAKLDNRFGGYARRWHADL